MEPGDLRAAAAFALKEAGSPYAWGAAGKPCTPAYRETLMRQYPRHAASVRAGCPALQGAGGCAGCGHRGRRLYDCAQFTRMALKACGISLPSGASSQWLRGPWAVRGELRSPVPKPHFAMNNPCVLFRADPHAAPGRPMAHVGVSLGDGRAADARGSRAGVVVMPLAAYPWTHFAVPRGMAMLGAGSRGELVERLQRALVALGFRLPKWGVDGVFGPETQAALDAMRKAYGMRETGPCGTGTLAEAERLAAGRGAADG
ncbi:MAG TPA: peptidoglycan-binding protein [Candidatus Limnocylindria bacterium]|nr:peptidoglycan-binding protein [Candidatus Limnocylindria bacterium]